MADQTQWDGKTIKVKLTSDPKRDEWLRRSVVAVWKRQTEVERETRETREKNGVGFTGVDAHILSSFAAQVMNGRTLSEKQMAILRRKMPKYANQLAKIANGEI